MNIFTTLFGRFFPFEKPRPNQPEIVERIIDAWESGKKFVVLEAPVGSGKSVVAYTAAKIMEKPSLYITSTKQLQDQVVRDFPVDVLKGRVSYTCHRTKGPCDPCECKMLGEKECGGEGSAIGYMCPFKQALMELMAGNFGVVNYHLFFIMGALNKSLLIADECHNLESIASDFVSTTLHRPKSALTGALDDCLLCNWDPTISVTAVTREFLIEILQSSVRRLSERHSAMRSVGFLSQEDRMLVLKIENAMRQRTTLSELLSNPEFQFVVDGDDKEHPFESKIRVRPVSIAPYIMGKFREFDHVLLMSATVLSKSAYLEQLGIDDDDCEFLTMPMTFPVENRRIRKAYVGKMSFKTINDMREQIADKVAAIVNKHKGERGIIHTHSFDMADIVMSIRNRGVSRRLIDQRVLKGRDKVLIQLEQMTDGVIVAPAMHEGLDLKDDLSRFQIIMKVPYPPLNDAMIKARMNTRKMYYEWLTLLKLVQSVGRSIRSETDHASTYVLDANMDVLLARSHKMVPAWFLEALCDENFGMIEDDDTIISLED